MINRKTAPEIIDAVNMQLQLKPYDHFTLDNGVPVYSIDAGAQEVLLIEWVFYAGNWYEDKNIVAATTNFMLKNGTRQKKAFAINEHFEFYGAYLNRSCYNETATITLHCLSKHLPDLLPVVAELMTESIFPEEELAIYKQNQKQRLEVNLKKCDFVANRLIDEYVYGFHHPYGKYTSTLDYDNLQRDELAAFYKRFYTEGKCLMFVAGKPPANIQEQLNSLFGHLPFRQDDLPGIVYTPQPAETRKYNIVNDPNGVQGAIRIARPFPNRHHPEFSKAQVLNNIFGGFFGSRLMSNIREDKGYTYGIHSYMQNHIHSSAWLISTEAGRDVCAATIDEVYKEMAILRNEPVDAEELDLVRNYMIGSLLGDLDGPFQVIARWKNYILNGLTDEYFYNSIRVVQSITAEEIQALAQRYLEPESFYEVVVV
ncbi:MAG: insulinase family protein [Chitinophagaceae bacterium]|nr:insulinase family protein [Chitinophagaceae bacterium]MEA3424773.1 pitrilysin family protein [Bacteroidota bacterium]MCA6452398.1 insulinase family protein [Chitinophagaceae bacterium]MCA6456633.1 insulinase family protein [Chitinophagaceae bacterium]MCA6458751.1 insulinase family protein [Chitinophagaceae bacterium]